MPDPSKPTSFFARHKHEDTPKVQGEQSETNEIEESTLKLLGEAADLESSGNLEGALDAYRHALQSLFKQVGKKHQYVAETFEKSANVMAKLELETGARKARESANEIYRHLFDTLSRRGKMKDAYIYFSRSKKIEALLEESSRPPSKIFVNREMERVSSLRSSMSDSHHLLPPRPPSKPRSSISETPSAPPPSKTSESPLMERGSLIRPNLASRSTSGTSAMSSTRSITSVTTASSSVSGLRPETQKFLKTLNGYLDCRRQMDQKYEEVDKATRLSKLELRTDSGGIALSDSDAKFKENYRQLSTNGEPVQSLEELYAAAQAAQPKFMEKIQFLVSQVCHDCNVDQADVKVFFADLKKQERALEKAQDDYDKRSPGPGISWLYDIVRGSVEFNSAEEIESFIRRLHEEKGIHIVKAKNRFHKPSLTGYRDMCVQFRIGEEDTYSHICEVQIHHKVILALDKRIGSHAFYEFFRSYFSGAIGSLEERLEDLELISKGALVNESFLENFLDQCEDADRLERLAKLFDKNLCEYDAAIQTYERLAEVLVDAHGPNHYYVAGTYSTIADILHTKGLDDEALDLYDKSARLCAESLGPVHPAIASMLNNMASVLCKQDRLDEGYATYGNAAKIYKFHLENQNSVFDHGHLKKSLAGTYHNMAGILFDQGKLNESLKLHREALEIKVQVLGETNEAVGLSHNSIGEVLVAQDKLEEAMVHYEKSLDIFKRTLGHSHSAVATCLQNMAELLSMQDKYDQSMDMFEMVLAIKTKNLGEEHSSVAHTYLAIASAKADQSMNNEAIELCKKALAIKKVTVGEHHSSVALIYVTLGKIYFSEGKLEEAMDMQWKALKITTNSMGREHHSLIEIYNTMATILLVQDQYEEAFARFNQALALATKIYGEDNTYIATIYVGLGRALKEQGKLDQAMEVFQQSLQIDRKTFGNDHSSVAVGQTRIASLMAERGDVDEALAAFNEALNWYAKRPGENIHDHVAALVSTGRLYSFVDLLDKAMEHFQQARVMCNKAGLHGQVVFTSVLDNIGDILRLQGKTDEALGTYRESTEYDRKIHGEEHYTIANGYNKIALILEGQGDFDGAMANYNRSLGWYEKRPGEYTLSFVGVLIDVGDMHRDLEQLDNAMKYFQRALDICNHVGFLDLPIAANIHSEIGETLRLDGKMEEAMDAFRESLAIQQKIHGEGHLSVINAHCAIANILVEQGDFHAAIVNFQRCLDWFEKRTGLHIISFARTLCFVGRMYIHQGQFDKSIDYLERALKICTDNGFGELYISGIIHSYLGLAQKLSGKIEESRKSYRATLGIYRHIYGQDHLALGVVNSDIGEVCIIQDDLKKAKKYLERAKEIHHSARVGNETALVAEVTLNFGLLKQKEGALTEALDLLQSAQRIFNETAHTWLQKDLRKKTKRAIIAIKTELGTKKEKKKKSSKTGGGWAKVKSTT